MTRIKLTVAQALIKFLNNQYVCRDEREHKFIVGMWGIFGHGNLSGLGQALEADRSLPFLQARNEQGMAHAAVAYAKQKRRLQTFACTSSIGPGATNMVTAAALATINRIPLLLLPGDIFAKRQAGPVLQQLESPASLDISVNDCFRPISRFWDRIYRWEQLLESLPEAMRVLCSPSETGAVTLALPQDVQTEAGFFPESFFEKRVHAVTRPQADTLSLRKALEEITRAERPLIIAGGGVNYSEAEDELLKFCRTTGIPVAETQAGKGALPFDEPMNLGAIGVTGTRSANTIAQKADLIIAIGTRLTDFTTGSASQFQNPSVRFININCDARDAHKYRGLALVGDAKLVLKKLRQRLRPLMYHINKNYKQEICDQNIEWLSMRSRLFGDTSDDGLSQVQALGLINEQLHKEDTVVAAAGSLPGDMHRFFHVHNSHQYHMEYGYSCMGYEIAGALGISFAKERGEVFALVGDGSYLMMHSEILTAIQENKKIIIIVFINNKFASIDRLSRSCGSAGFGNEFRGRTENGSLTGEVLAIDYIANARSYGAEACKAQTAKELTQALSAARASSKSTVIALEVNQESPHLSCATQWKVPVAEVSTSEDVQAARRRYEEIFERSSI